MGMFDKKYCDICGEKIGLLGNRKLEDGNLCKNCASKLSPWFTGRRHSSLADIKSQLEDREANRSRAAAFRRTQKSGDDGRALYLDETQGNFAVCYESDWKNGNPDILPLSAVISCRYENDEHKTERKHKDAEGKLVSYNPPVYDYSYDFYIVIDVEHPYIDEIKFRVNNMALSREEGSMLSGGSRKIIECENLCRQIVERLNGGSGINAPQNDLTIVIPQIMAPYRAVQPGGAFEMKVRLYIKGGVVVRVTDAAMCNEYMAAEYIRDVISRIIVQLEQEGTDIRTVDASLLERRLMMTSGGAGLQQFGLELKGTNLVPSIDPEDVRMMERMMFAGQNFGTVNAAPAYTAPVSQEWVCAACGGRNEGGKFCTYCGTPRS